jgi:hypothetical protein
MRELSETSVVVSVSLDPLWHAGTACEKTMISFFGIRFGMLINDKKRKRAGMR